MRRFLVILALILPLLGCTSEDPHPELKDPIHKDLKAQIDSYKKAMEEADKRLVELRPALEKAEANSIEQKDVRKDIAKQERIIREGKKWMKYYQIRADRRAVMDKITAREAASTGKPWPDPDEYSDYLLNKRLREAPLNWNARVPKLQDRLKAPKAEKPAAEKPAAH